MQVQGNNIIVGCLYLRDVIIGKNNVEDIFLKYSIIEFEQLLCLGKGRYIDFKKEVEVK